MCVILGGVPRPGWVKPTDDQRLSDHVALGVLTRTFPPELVDAILAELGRGEQRHRLLPARLVTYYVLAMALFSSAGYEEVMRNLVEGLSWESGWRQSLDGAVAAGDLPGAGPPGCRTVGGVVRPGVCAVGDAGDAGRVLAGVASGEHRRHDAGRGRHGRERGRVRAAGVGPR